MALLVKIDGVEYFEVPCTSWQGIEEERAWAKCARGSVSQWSCIGCAEAPTRQVCFYLPDQKFLVIICLNCGQPLLAIPLQGHYHHGYTNVNAAMIRELVEKAQ